MLMLALPNHSYASWTLSTRVMTTGGGIQVGSGSILTSVNGTVQKSYTTSSIVPVKLLPNTGYYISGVSVNGTALSSPLPSTVSMGLPAYPGKTSQTLAASFAKIMVPVVIKADTPGGSVSSSGTYNLYYGTNVSSTFTPLPGYSVWNILGVPAGATVTSVSDGSAVTFPYAGAVRVAFTVGLTPVNLSGAFVPLLANAGAPKTILPGGTAVLQGSVKTYDGASPVTASYAWSLKSGPGQATIASPNASVTSFTATTPGTYTVQLAVTDSLNATSTVTTYVMVADSFAAAGRSQCQACHQSAGFTSTTFNSWSSSKHKVDGVVCAYCHIASDTGGHPTLHMGTVDKDTYLFKPIINPDPALGTGSFCLNGTCHNPGVTHKTNGMICSTCHTGGTHNTDATFAASLDVCSNCHTTSSNCLGYTTDQCVTCHTTVHGPKLLHHFAFANITTQQAGTKFSVTVTAQDIANNTVTGFTEIADLTVSNDPEWKLTTANFVGGVWSDTISLSKAGTGITLTATRTGGRETGTSNPFTVTELANCFNFSWLPPVTLDKAFEKGATIPVKFQVTDCNGAAIPDLPVKLEVYPVSGDTMADDPVMILSNVDEGDDFRYSEDHYIFNLDTSNLALGSYHLHAVFQDGPTYMIGMTLVEGRRH